MAKLQPAVKTMQFEVLPSNYAFIDLSQCASMLNRRFYRQGLLWAVGGFTVINRANPGTNKRLLIEKLPETWVMYNAWVKGFKTWNKMNYESLRETESVRPKFLDFKIFMDAVHHEDGVLLNQTPVAYDGAAYKRGEWDMSKMVIPRTDGTDDVHNREIIAIGANYPGAGASSLGAVSLIEGYAASRALPDILDPNAPLDMTDAYGDTPENWMAATFNEGTEQDSQVLSDMFENNTPPYPFENGPDQSGGPAFTDTQYPGGANNPVGGGTLEIHDFADISGTTIGARTMLRGGTFPCGLLKFSNNADSIVDLLIHLVPGHHRGYLAEPMQDV